jgi:CMP-N-acetylneuraminic acid synthetase
MARILTVVPARGGSKGVRGKNLRPLDGLPLIAHLLRTLARCTVASRVIVSTDSPEIAKVAEAEGAEVPFMRPAALARDEIPITPVIQHAMRFMDEAGWSPDLILSVQPTAPLLTAQSIDAALTRIIADERVGSVASVSLIRHFHPFRAYRLDEDGVLAPLTEYTTERFLQKQDRPAAYGMTGGFYVRRRALLEDDINSSFALGEVCASQVVSEEEAIDIDSEVDFLLAEAVLHHRRERAAAAERPRAERLAESTK